MLKKILIGVGVVIVILVIAFAYLNHRNRTMSPPGEASLSNSGLSVTINYSRPSVRDRLIFGLESDGALLPHGKYWRLGANEPTTIAVDKDFRFNETNVSAGTYTIYAIPEANKMLLKLNSEVQAWGTFVPKPENDVANTLADMEGNAKTEQFTIVCEPIEGGVNVLFFWDTYVWEVPILKQ